MGEVDLEDDDPDIINHMIAYLYRLDYEDEPNSPDAKSAYGRLILNAHIYAVADKYEILSMKDLAEQKTAAALVDLWSYDGFLKALEVVWTTTP